MYVVHFHYVLVNYNTIHFSRDLLFKTFLLIIEKKIFLKCKKFVIIHKLFLYLDFKKSII